MQQPEITLNLWYVQNAGGLIYSLRTRAYVGVGSDRELLANLRKHAPLDYLIARVFPIPAQFHTTLISGDHQKKLPVVLRSALNASGHTIAIFEDAIKALTADLPAQTELDIPEAPLVCLTTVLSEDGMPLRPITDSEKS